VWHFRAGQEDLGSFVGERLDDDALMCKIQFRRQIIEHDDRPLAVVGLVKLGLSQHAGDCTKFFLPPRQLLTPGRQLEAELPIRTMRAACRVSALPIRAMRFAQGHRKFALGIPTRHILKDRLTQIGQ
jgi:hypothetical protein